MKTFLKLFSIFSIVAFTSTTLSSCSNKINPVNPVIKSKKLNLNYFNDSNNIFKSISGVEDNSLANLKLAIDNGVEKTYEQLEKIKLNSNQIKEFDNDLQIDVSWNQKPKQNIFFTNFNLKYYQKYYISLRSKVENNYFFNSNDSEKDYVFLTKVDFIKQIKFSKEELRFTASNPQNEILKILKLIQQKYNSITNQHLNTIESDPNIKITLNNNNTNFQISISKNDSYFFEISKPYVNPINIVIKNFDLQNLNLSALQGAKNASDFYNQIYNQINIQFANSSFNYWNDSNLNVEILNSNGVVLNKNDDSTLNEQYNFNVKFQVNTQDKYFLPCLFYQKITLSKFDITNLNVTNFIDPSLNTIQDLAKNIVNNLKQNYIKYVNYGGISEDILSASYFNWKIKDLTNNVSYNQKNWTKKIDLTHQYQVYLSVNDNSKYFLECNSYLIGNYKNNKVTISQDITFLTPNNLITYWGFYNLVYQKLVNIYNSNHISKIVNINVLKIDSNLKVTIFDQALGRVEINRNDNKSFLKIKNDYLISIQVLTNDIYFNVFEKSFHITIPKINKFDSNYFLYSKNFYKTYKNVGDLLEPTINNIANYYNLFVSKGNKITSADISNDKNLKIYYTYKYKSKKLDPTSLIKLGNTLQIHIQTNENDIYFSKQDIVIKSLSFVQPLDISNLQNYLQSNIFYAINGQLSQALVIAKIVQFVNDSKKFQKPLTWNKIAGGTLKLNVNKVYNPQNNIKIYDVSITTKNNIYFTNGSFDCYIYLSAYNSNNLKNTIISQSLQNLISQYKLSDLNVLELKNKVVDTFLTKMYNNYFKTDITNQNLINDLNLNFEVIDLTNQTILSDDAKLSKNINLQIRLTIANPDQYFTQIQNCNIFEFKIF